MATKDQILSLLLSCRGSYLSGEELAPVYCRLSQAERERLEREAKSK